MPKKASIAFECNNPDMYLYVKCEETGWVGKDESETEFVAQKAFKL